MLIVIFGGSETQTGCWLSNKMAAATKLVNPNSEVVARSSTLMVNISAARGLQQVLKSNLGA